MWVRLDRSKVNQQGIGEMFLALQSQAEGAAQSFEGCDSDQPLSSRNVAERTVPSAEGDSDVN